MKDKNIKTEEKNVQQDDVLDPAYQSRVLHDRAIALSQLKAEELTENKDNVYVQYSVKKVNKCLIFRKIS